MDEQQRKLAGIIFKTIRPVLILAILAFYLMGAGVYRYLGGQIDWTRFFSGLVCVILLHNSCMLLNEFFDIQLRQKSQSNYPAKKYQLENTRVGKNSILSAGLVTLASGSVLIFYLAIQNEISPAGILVYFIALLASISYSIPPYKLSSRGMGEIVLTILITNLYPAFAYLLQDGGMHRLVAMITLPLTALFLAGWISNGLSSYLKDMLDHKTTLLQVLQWKLGMDIHNLLILLCYIIVGIAVFMDLPKPLTWPFFITLPLSILSISEVCRIKSGSKPRWSVLLYSSYGAIGCTVYLVIFALWTA